jgi:hypothetical protein
MSLFGKSSETPYIPDLTSILKDGTVYQRLPVVLTEIATMLRLGEREWVAAAKKLRHETLVYLIRDIKIRHGDEEIRGKLLLELSRRILRVAKHWMSGVKKHKKDELAEEIEFEILQLVLAERPSTQSEYLEVVFEHVVKARTLDAVRKLNRTPEGWLQDLPPNAEGDEGEDVLQFLARRADPGPTPEVACLIKDDLRVAEAAVKDPRDWEVLKLRHIEGMPIECKDGSEEDIPGRTGETVRRTKYRLDRAENAILKAMRRWIK